MLCCSSVHSRCFVAINHAALLTALPSTKRSQKAWRYASITFAVIDAKCKFAFVAVNTPTPFAAEQSDR